MMHTRPLPPAALFFAALAIAPPALADPAPGWSAELTTRSHGVSGTVTVLDADTIRIDDFHYDGLGLSVYVYLAQEYNFVGFINGLRVGPQLLGTPYSGGSLTIDLPVGHTIDGYVAVSVWCEAVGSSFGDGAFIAPPPACEGDLNDDDVVNTADLGLLLGGFGATGDPGALFGDLNSDGVVNTADLGLLISAFGPCPE